MASPEGGRALGIAGLSEAAGLASSSSCKSLHEAARLALLSLLMNERRFIVGVGPDGLPPFEGLLENTGSVVLPRSESL